MLSGPEDRTGRSPLSGYKSGVATPPDVETRVTLHGLRRQHPFPHPSTSRTSQLPNLPAPACTHLGKRVVPLGPDKHHVPPLPAIAPEGPSEFDVRLPPERNLQGYLAHTKHPQRNLQGYLAHKRNPPPQDHHRSLGRGYCRVLRGGCLL